MCAGDVTTSPAASTKMMSRGSGVFFIQNVRRRPRRRTACRHRREVDPPHGPREELFAPAWKLLPCTSYLRRARSRFRRLGPLGGSCCTWSREVSADLSAKTRRRARKSAFHARPRIARDRMGDLDTHVRLIRGVDCKGGPESA